MTQLAIPFPHRAALGRADFLAAPCNEAAIAWIERWPAWPAGALVLHGPPGCGKTHLASLWRERSRAMLIPGERLDEALLTEAIEAHNPAVAIDDAERTDERLLLHLYNACREYGGAVLLTAALPPADWPIALPDLRSRLLANPAVAVGAPDETLLAAVLVKHFADRQLRVLPEVLAYLVPRLERSFAAAAAAVARLDAAALATGRAVTVPLARRVLAEIQGPASSSGVA